MYGGAGTQWVERWLSMCKSWVSFPKTHRHGVMAHGCHPSTVEVETEVQGHPQVLISSRPSWAMGDHPGLQEILSANKITWIWKQAGDWGSAVLC